MLAAEWRFIFTRCVARLPEGRRPEGASDTIALDPMAAPAQGYDDLLRRFGDPSRYLRSDGTLSASWEKEHIVRRKLPAALPYAFAPDAAVTRIACHRLAADAFALAFERVLARGVAPDYLVFAGCFQPRRKVGGEGWSTHTWGLAVDLRPATNPFGAPTGDMDARVVAEFEAAGFEWGGRWTRRDAMHFQYVTGY